MALKELRFEIDKVDAQLEDLISKKIKLAQDIGKLKKTTSRRVRDKEREKQVLDKWTFDFKRKGVNDKKFVKKLLSVLMKKSREVQK